MTKRKKLSKEEMIKEIEAILKQKGILSDNESIAIERPKTITVEDLYVGYYDRKYADIFKKTNENQSLGMLSCVHYEVFTSLNTDCIRSKTACY